MMHPTSPTNDHSFASSAPSSARRRGFWQNPRVAVVLFASSFAFAAFFALGVRGNADASVATADTSSMNVLEKLVFRTQQLWEGGLFGSSRLLNPHHEHERPTVLVMGLPRSGSIAVHDFFICNKVPSSHYCCDTSGSTFGENKKTRTEFPCGKDQTPCGDCVLQNMQNEWPPLEGCGDYHVWSQFDVETTEPYSWFLPQHFALPLLQDAYPRATVILNRRRDAGVWADSVLHWHSTTTRLFHSFNLDMIEPKDLPTVPENITYESLLEDMQISLNRVLDENDHLRKRDLLIKVYSRHIHKVRNWARQYNHPLVEINVDDAAGAKKTLSTAFQGTNPSCWKFDADKLDNDWKDFSFPFDDL